VKIQQLVDERDVALGLSASGVDGALEAVAGFLAERHDLRQEAVTQALMDRERLGTTAVGDGFAIPHCKIGGLSSIVVGVARFAEPVEFDAADSSPVEVLFAVLSPPEKPAAHLQVLSQIARILKRPAVREALRSAPDPAAVVSSVRAAAEEEGV